MEEGEIGHPPGEDNPDVVVFLQPAMGPDRPFRFHFKVGDEVLPAEVQPRVRLVDDCLFPALVAPHRILFVNWMTRDV
jgi:hypothetical protein